jgi:hypothetical protein
MSIPSQPTPVTWRALILTAVGLSLLMAALTAAIGWWAWKNLATKVVLRDQQVDIVMPSELAVRATVSNEVQVRLDQVMTVRVPIHETLIIPMNTAIPLKVSIDTTVPIHLDVPVEHVLHVDQTMDLDTQVKTRILGFSVTVPIKGKVPLKADIPISLVIPVRKELPVSLTAPAMVRLTEPLKAQVDTVVTARVPIRETLSMPVTAPVNAMLTFPQQHVTAGLSLLDMTLPFDAITFGLKSAVVPAGAKH